MKTIQLQQVGKVSAKPAFDFKVGESMAWNFGSTTKIINIVKETAKMITFQFDSEKNGETHERKFLKTRLVAIG